MGWASIKILEQSTEAKNTDIICESIEVAKSNYLNSIYIDSSFQFNDFVEKAFNNVTDSMKKPIIIRY